jgi:hypothetical protein
VDETPLNTESKIPIFILFVLFINNIKGTKLNYGQYAVSALNSTGGDLARQTKFNIFITLPSKFEHPKKKTFGDKIDILAKTVNIPNIKHDFIDFKYKGHSIPIAARTNFDQGLSITFYLDEVHEIRSVLDEWARSCDQTVFGESTNKLNTSERYGSLKIQANNFDDTSVSKGYEFFNVFPTSVSSPEFSSDAQSTVIEITVEFSYSYYILKEGSSNLGNIFENLKNKAINAIGDALLPKGISTSSATSFIGAGMNLFE